ncbi:MAG: 50S ribosome-binding GTPase [Pseudomonadota bacterium]|nr:50S ribosome-binding GTPase [Pseudomonadota bacterium]
MKFSPRWLAAIAVIVLPAITLLPLGLVWLWQQGLILEWLLVLACLAGAAWLMLVWLNRKHTVALTDKPEVQPDPHWPDRNRAAWDKATAITEKLTLADYPLDDPARLIELGRETITAVARHYHPKSKNAPFEIAIPYLLMIIELVSKDLRRLLDNIPFSHMLTIHDLMRGHSLASFTSKCYDVYRLGSLAINPVAAVLRELRDLTTHQALRYPADEIKTWLLQSYVKKVAYYAIELYSGALILSDRPTAEYITKYSRTDLERRPPAEEPLRLLVLGQVKAGKSSLINALFGELRAMTDVLPLTSGIIPYVLERDEARRMIVLDSAGYAGPAADQGFHEAEAELLRSDLILLVCSATNAARHADRQLLNNINVLFQRRPDLIAPPLLVVLTHVDQLRPLREWDPPYNIAQPQRPKEQAIRAAMEATAEDLGIDVGDVIAVNSRPEQIYNIEEGVIPAILGKLDHSQRVQYLRCLRELKREDHWNRLREQAWKAGRILLAAGARMAAETIARLSDEVKGRSPD